MTMNPLQSYRSLAPSGVRTNGVRLRLVSLSFWIVASFLFVQLQVLPFLMPVENYSIAADVSSEIYTAGFELQDQESNACCPDLDCSDSQDCSLPCASSCPTPLVAVLEHLLYRDSLSSTDLASALIDSRFVQPMVAVPIRPPIV